MKIKSSKLKIKIKRFRLPVIIFTLITFATPVFGAILYLEPGQGNYYREDVFIIEVKIDTGGEDINAVKVNLTFSQNVLEVEDFMKGDSILKLWPEEPIFSNQAGTIYFMGGIPGGYQGENGILGKIILKARSGGEGTLQIKKDSQVLLNDGFGSPAELEIKEGIFNILPEKLEVPKNEREEELKKDKIPPEPFGIKIGKEPSIFDGKYFIAFSTADRGLGIDYYEIKEGDRGCKKGSTPYLLEDQSLRSKILVRAVDKAGNERMAEVIPPKEPFPWQIMILLSVILVIIWWLLGKVIYRMKQKPQKIFTPFDRK